MKTLCAPQHTHTPNIYASLLLYPYKYDSVACYSREDKYKADKS